MDHVPDLPRSRRLKTMTHGVHDQLDRSIMEASSFDSLQGYARFVAMQRVFHRDIDALYGDAALEALLPGLSGRRRLSLIETDLSDMGQPTPLIETPPVFPQGRAADVATALGWLYVAEGSRMGGALLRKEAAGLGLSDDHGARHLAPPPEGPAAFWRAFTGALDAIALTPEEDVRVIEGADAAFARVQALANAALR